METIFEKNFTVEVKVGEWALADVADGGRDRAKAALEVKMNQLEKSPEVQELWKANPKAKVFITPNWLSQKDRLMTDEMIEAQAALDYMALSKKMWAEQEALVKSMEERSFAKINDATSELAREQGKRNPLTFKIKGSFKMVKGDA